MLLPAWHHGVPVLAHRVRQVRPRGGLRADGAHGVRNVFLPPTALKLMRQAGRDRGASALALRSIGSGGETLGDELLDWGRATFGVTINEFYGQTECNLVVVATAPALMPVRPGSMGRAVPGHDVAIVDDDGEPAAAGEVGADRASPARPGDVPRLLEQPGGDARRSSPATGCSPATSAAQDEDGYFWFVGRDDDVITIGRLPHRSRRDRGLPAAPPGGGAGRGRRRARPDAHRDRQGLRRAASRGRGADDALAREIQDFVRTRLAAHEYPREIEFVDELPMTATGKIMRRELRER